MSSSLRRRPRGRVPALLLAVTLGGLGACGSSDDVHEILGGVQTLPAEVPQDPPSGPAAPTIAFKPFRDDVGRRAATETRALITSAAGYSAYFGHAAPPEVNFNAEWVIFYAAGTQRSGGYRADVRTIAANGDALNVVTVLFTPGAGCAVTDALTSPFVLVKFSAQKTRSVIFQHSAQSTRCGEPSPLPPGCAAILCPAGSVCVLDKSNPPVAHCEAMVPPTDPARCTSSQQCGKGQRCSTERGECLGCGAMSSLVACPAVCFGVCEPTPIPGPSCTTNVLMGGCRSEEVIKAEAAEACKQRGWSLTEFGVGNACFAGGFVEAKFTCCGPDPMPPPPMCTGGLLMGGCRTGDAIKLEAAEICKRQNLVLTDFGLGSACFAGGFVEAKYLCCGAQPPPPPACKVDSDCTLASNYCGDMPCTCRAVPPGGAMPACASPQVACLVDPCRDKVAACVAGQCTVQPGPTPPPPPACTWDYMGGVSSCKPYGVWKQYAYDACKEKGQTLNNLATGGMCEGGNFVEIKYECCPTR